MSNTINLNLSDKVIARETADEDINMPITFVKHVGTRPQHLLIDAEPDELYYNPSSKTLFVDNIETKIANLQEGEAILIDNSVSNKTTVNVNFTKNTEVVTSILDNDTFLVSNTSNALKTITGLLLSNQLRAGLCPLNSNNIIPNQYLPGSVSDILEVANFAALPSTGDSSKIYVTLDNHKAYRWGGTSYVEISASLVIGTTTGTAYDGSSGQANADAITGKQATITPGSNLSFSGNTLNVDSTLTGITLTTPDILTNCNISATSGFATLEMGGPSGAFIDLKKPFTDDYDLRILFNDTGQILSKTSLILMSNNTTALTIDTSQNSTFAGDIDIGSGKKYKLNGDTMIQDLGFGGEYNCRILKNVSSDTNFQDGLYINYASLGTNPDVRIYAGGTNNQELRAHIKASSGNMGLGTAPHATYKLNIAGDCNITGLYRINGTAIINSDTTYTFAGTNLVTAANGTDISLNTTLTGITLTTPNISENCNIISASGFATLEMGGPSGAFIDLKKPFTDDYDLRILFSDTGQIISKSSLILMSNNTTALTIDTSQNSTFVGDVTVSGKLTNTGGSRITIQNGVDGGTANGIAMWNSTDTNWAIYMAQSGANKSFAGGTAVAGYDFAQHAIRFRVNDYTLQGFIFENGNEELCMSINGGNKNVYMASNLIVSKALFGGGGNASGNFHIDNNSATGDLILSYTYNNNVRIGNPSTGSQGNSAGSGPYTSILSNRDTPLIISNNYASTISAGFHCGIKQNLALDTTSMTHSFMKKGTMHHTATVGYVLEGSSNKPLWLNCEQGGTVDWEPGGKFAPQGEAVVCKEIFCGARANVGVSAGLTNNPKITVGRNASYDYGIHLGGWTSTVLSNDAQLANSGNFHIDGSNSGDMYLNYYGQNSSRDCRIFRCICTSDRRIKTNFIPINNDELLNQIENLELTTYNFKDPKFKSDENTLGFIADSLQHKSYFDGFVVVGSYNMPFDEIDQIELDYVLKDKVITVSNYILDLTKEYYYYAYKSDGQFLTIQNKPLSENSFEYQFDDEFIRLVVIGEKRNDCKSIKPEKLIPGAYAGIQSLITKNKYLENEVIELKNTVNELEQKINSILDKLS